MRLVGFPDIAGIIDVVIAQYRLDMVLPRTIRWMGDHGLSQALSEPEIAVHITKRV